MHPVEIFLLASASVASATLSMGQKRVEMDLRRIVARQSWISIPIICSFVPPPVTCARSCGAGYVECGASTCFKPSRGDICCSNGKSCPQGTYCSDGGCCDNGDSLAECGASVTLATVASAAPIPTTTSSRSSSVSTSSRTRSSSSSSGPSLLPTVSRSTGGTGSRTPSAVSPTRSTTSSPPPTDSRPPQVMGNAAAQIGTSAGIIGVPFAVVLLAIGL
ncbi:hypothetical protein P152DRAFT_315830 [Eremomyces bilateralis CBS 781.70]|uniref:GPI anchored protein n=1 Tax=Eremomyces bilateralis CBS 781.70 TaxID=1392243 RepID=A0A6G1G5L4_9PEZI|nr:uncharacterized protein P152DRAFT_315830 [Eremomyces bilateralis CBS 781.70]KAF1813357.1 hypothetical protein P152DRAFT_315830 [Eremomyces bilateralis CBS 781.70]